MAIVSVNLIFDEGSEAEIYALWRQLSDEGIPVSIPDRYRPHITVVAFDAVDPVALSNVVSKIADGHAPIDINLSPLGSFPENGVLFLAPRVSDALLSFQRHSLHEIATNLQVSLMSDYLTSDRWIPHVTLVKDVDQQGLARAFGVALSHWKPIDAKGIALATRVHPVLDDFSVYKLSAPKYHAS